MHLRLSPEGGCSIHCTIGSVDRSLHLARSVFPSARIASALQAPESDRAALVSVSTYRLRASLPASPRNPLSVAPAFPDHHWKASPPPDPDAALVSDCAELVMLTRLNVMIHRNAVVAFMAHASTFGLTYQGPYIGFMSVDERARIQSLLSHVTCTCIRRYAAASSTPPWVSLVCFNSAPVFQLA